MTKYNYPEHYCKNATEAIRLAEKLKVSGKYDLFRGQRHTYDIRPSISRPNVDVERASQRLDDFTRWVHETPDLQSLHHDIEAILAVAQHYGIPTPLLDFTYSPQVAGFFATDGGEDEDTGTIICINRERFMRSWDDLNNRYYSSEGRTLIGVVEIDVKNLWRLQAQNGLFIRCHVDPTLLEMFSFMLHIYFPQRSGTKILDSDRIYPKEKSHLEVMLDHYFLIETYENRMTKLQEIFKNVIKVDNSSMDNEIASYFISETLPPTHKSWESHSAQLWYTEPDERFLPSTVPNIVSFNLPESEDTDKFELELSKIIEEAIIAYRSSEQGHIIFSIFLTDGSTAYINSEGCLSPTHDECTLFSMAEMVNVIYAGMRYLPYTNKQIIRAITRYILMVHFGCYEIINQTQGVEFSGGRIRGRGFCNENNLLKALREDFYDFVKPEELNNQGLLDFEDLLYISRGIKYAYVFEKFLELFVEDLIPSQAAVAIENLTIGVNPMRLDVFGAS